MSAPFASHREALLAAVGLIEELVELRRRRRAGEAVAPDLLAWAERRRALRADLEASHAAGVPMRLIEVVQGFGLTDTELDLLLVALIPLVDPEFLDRLGRAHETYFFRGVDLDLALSLVFPRLPDQLAGRRLLAPEGTLVRTGLLSLVPIESRLNPHEVELRPSDAVAAFLLERPPLSGALSRFCRLADPSHRWEQVVVPEAQTELLAQVVGGEPMLLANLQRWGYGDVLPSGRGVVLLFAGPPGTGKTAFAHAIAQRLGWRVLTVRTSYLLAVREPILPLLQDVMRTAELERAVVLFDDCEGLLSARDARFHAMLEALEASDNLVVMTTNQPASIDIAINRRIQLRVDFEPPTAAMREHIWELHLPPEVPLSEDIDVRALAATYEVTGAVIRNAVLVALARMTALGEPRLTMERLREATETQLPARLDEYAVRARSDGRLADLVLPDDEAARLRDVLDACRVHDDVLTSWGFGRRLTTGRGLCLLFDGPPGTGKTFTAELLAGELRLPLYRIHIPNVVSKWVGETERNIAEIFTRARSARAVLLFDEADSLFGRRTSSAQTATDRYANMEVNLLLQEIERYDGITVLTTNLFGSLDDALQRRIQFRVTFPFPGPPERARIWKGLIPPEAPLGDDVDLAVLGKRFELAGGHIKNAVLRAAYRARSRGDVIRQADFVSAALAECEAQGKLVRQPSGRTGALGAQGASVRTAQPVHESPPAVTLASDS